MPYADADGVKLYYEEAGDGDPLVFVHEFGGDHRSWEAQMRFFSRRYRCVAHCARGYAPSDVPDDPADYAQDRQADDVAAVLDHIGAATAHVVGLSMGGFATLHFGMRHPTRARSLTVAGVGSGAPKGEARETFIRDSMAAADGFETAGSAAMAESIAAGPTRIQLEAKDPRGWAEFKAHLAEHSAKGSANTLRGYQAARPSLYDLEDHIRAVAVPTLIAVGDEDEPCLDASLWLKRVMPWAGLWVVPRTGHCINLEEPAAFNARVLDFLTQVEQGRWHRRAAAATGTAAFTPAGEE